MPQSSAPLDLGEEQVLFFRARRGHLVPPGAATPAAAARAILGAQSQQVPPSLLALSARTRGRPTAAALAAALETAPRELVRTWGQRDTVHVYDAASEWADVVTARGDWVISGRRGLMPPEPLVAKARKALQSAGRPLTRRDLFPMIPKAYLRAVQERVGAGDAAMRFAAGRALWRLALDGDACAAGKVGAEQFYAARTDWFPDLPWPSGRPDAPAAAVRLTGRYLATYGPATPADVAHFFGARVSSAREWLARLAKGTPLIEIRCGDRKGLVARAADATDLRAKPPRAAAAWPPRLLPLWDCLLMGHADKSWTAPDEAVRKAVWRKAAFVAAVVMHRGRIVATWSHARKGRRLSVTVETLPPWKAAVTAGVKRDAQDVAAHLGLEGADVSIGKA
jgi:DNA glycosylase AlkZ-like